MKSLVTAFFLLLLSASAWSQKGVFLSPEAFQHKAFPAGDGRMQTLWLTRGLRDQAETILNHSFAGLRVRYWTKGARTAWIFDEIGKELPITVGVVIENNLIQTISILAFRESRGGEVRYPFFTEQFERLGLIKTPRKYDLTGNIDGITGATLSVRAVKKIATLALLFHHQTPATQISKLGSKAELVGR